MSALTESTSSSHFIAAWQASQQDFQRCLLPNSPETRHQPSRKHIFIISGPAGCGKSTVASHLSEELGVPYLEGGVDRWEWLKTLREESMKLLGSTNIVLVACSALKRSYRDVFRAVSNSLVQLHFVYLAADETVLMERVRAREGHFMKDFMLRSQLETLEEPAPDETDVLTISLHQNRLLVQQRALKMVCAALEV